MNLFILYKRKTIKRTRVGYRLLVYRIIEDNLYIINPISTKPDLTNFFVNLVCLTTLLGNL